mgnify:CR=1 FL=1
MENYVVMFGILLAGMVLFGCLGGDITDSSSQLANPASSYCVEQGGSLEIVTQPDGGQIGMCTLPNGNVCEEWAYYRGECS